jgi:hypothetical protein
MNLYERVVNSNPGEETEDNLDWLILVCMNEADISRKEAIDSIRKTFDNMNVIKDESDKKRISELCSVYETKEEDVVKQPTGSTGKWIQHVIAGFPEYTIYKSDVVHVKLKGGHILTGQASSFDWLMTGKNSDIAKYMILLPGKT